MKKTIVFYHDKCNDGFASALAAWLKFGDAAHYVPLSYGDKMPMVQDLAGLEVYVLDFSFSKELTLAIANVSKKFTMLDHHISAMNDFKSTNDEGPTLSIPLKNGEIHFDMTKSAAMMTWEHFHQYKTPPLFKFIQDYDLGKTFKGTAIAGTEAFIRRLAMEDKSFESWNRLITPNPLNQGQTIANQFVSEGEILLKAHEQACLNIMSNGAQKIVLNNVEGLAINGGQEHINLLGHMLAQKSGTFGALWRTDGQKVSISLRAEGKCDLTEIAAVYGGGGHKNAAGITMSLTEFLPLLTR